MSTHAQVAPPKQRLHAFTARAVSRLNPTAIRNRQFPTKRRGLHPEEVSAFLSEVAGEIATLHRELIIAQQENERLKRALRDWQTQQATFPQGLPHTRTRPYRAALLGEGHSRAPPGRSTSPGRRRKFNPDE
ncbi:MAG TPA: DivIVA domain-containing protein [Micromonospora sp.]|nr:DivIVA domain-containing protein [Micromonospora sp.]